MLSVPTLEPVSRLRAFFEHHPKLALGFSGGCDSSYLLYAAVQAGVDVAAYCVRTPFQPDFEIEDARQITEMLHVPLRFIDIDILSDERVASNPQNRCYFCKRAIFGHIQKAAMSDGYDIICDGTNASDDIADRPGFIALQELGIESPLRQAGLTKSLIRHLSTIAGLPTAAKPAYACLATRFPTGVHLTHDGLRRVEDAENRLRQLGFSDFRVRVFHGAARLQFTSRDLERAVKLRDDIRRALETLFEMVFFDSETR